jgi:hypothetical protein
MVERHDKGGVQEQLRTLAANSSFDAAWDKSVKQRVSVQREVSIPNIDEAFLRAAFLAEKIPRKLSRPSQLLTRYTLSTTLIYDQLPIELVPKEVQEVIKVRRFKKTELEELEFESREDDVANEEETSTRTLEEYDDSDARFRFEREARYLFNGHGHLMSETRSDSYYEIDDGDELATQAIATLQFHSKDDGATGYLMQLETNIDDRSAADLLEHPDIRKVEYGVERSALREDFTFWELIETAERDENLLRLQRKDHTREALAILAFLHNEAAASEIMSLLN